MTDNLDLAELQKDISSLKHDLASLVEHVKRTVNQAGRGAAGQLGDEAERIYRTVAEKGRRRADKLSHKVEEQPIVSVLLAFGLGIIASRLLRR